MPTAAAPAAVEKPAAAPAKPVAPAVAAAANATVDALEAGAAVPFEVDVDENGMPPYPKELEEAEAAAAAKPPTKFGKPEDANDVEMEAAEAPADDETPADEEPTDVEEDVEPDAEIEAEPEETAAKPPETTAADPAAIEAQKQQAAALAAAEAAFTQYSKDFQEAEALLAADPKDFDSIEHSQKVLKTLAAGQKLLANSMAALHQQQQVGQVEREVAAHWKNWGEDNPEVGAERGQKLFAEEIRKARAKYPTADARALQIAATEKWEARMKQIRAKAKDAEPAKEPAKPAAKPAAAAPAKPAAPPAGKPKPVVTKDGGKITPRTTSNRPPAPKPRTEEEEYAAAYRDVGSVSAMID